MFHGTLEYSDLLVHTEKYYRYVSTPKGQSISKFFVLDIFNIQFVGNLYVKKKTITLGS